MWFADLGAADFYQEIWRDERVAEELRKSLVSPGVRSIVEEMIDG